MRSPEEARDIKLGQPSYAAGFQVQPEMSYHPGHAWALIEGPGRARIGIDDFAAKLIGEVDGIDLPHLGDQIIQGQQAWVLHHGDRQAPMLAPVTGEVIAINPRVRGSKVSFSGAPYTQEWLLSVRSPHVCTDFNNLLRGDLPRKWIEVVGARLRTHLNRGFALSFPDGGTAVDGVSAMVDEAEWNDIVHEFLLTDPKGR
jgi:glycine cleavage system H protein